MNLKMIFSGDSRSVKAKKNILVSCFFKGADMLIYLMLVPLTLGYLNPFEYGIWLTINSILGWINSFDIGLGNGLRNKLSEAIAQNDKQQARKYISTAFVLMVGLVIILCAIGMLCIYSIDWYKLLNVPNTEVSNIREIVALSFIFFCFNFILKIVGNVYQALQVPSAMYIMNFMGHALAIIAILILKYTTEGSLMWVAVVYSAASPLIYLCAYPITFFYLFKDLKPSLRFFDKRAVKSLFNLSVIFFFLQIASVVLFSLSNIIISNMFGPEEVTPYNIVQRYFHVILMIFTIVLSPMWSATTDAYAQGDFTWIKSTNLKLNKALGYAFILMFVMVFVSPFIFQIWIGDEVEIPMLLTLLMAIYTIIIMYSTSYSFFLNGMGKLKLQAINTITVAICFYPLCRFLALHFGVSGVLLCMCIVNLSGAIFNTIQFKKIVNRTDKGIWSK